MHVVVDTSFWIDFHRGALKAAERERIESAILDGRVILHQLVWLELLVGYRSEKEQKILSELRQISIWEPISSLDGDKAEEIAEVLRTKGRIVGASDLLILAAAIRLNAQIAHHDNHFTLATTLSEYSQLAWS